MMQPDFEASEKFVLRLSSPNNTVFFNDFNNGAIVGFAYPKISFGLNELKSLNKIEINHNQNNKE